MDLMESETAGDAKTLLTEAMFLLDGAGLQSPQADARTLLAYVLGIDLGKLVLVDEVSDSDRRAFLRLVDRRATGTPLQHITGVAHFRTIDVAVGRGVFVPRPETEVMTGWAVERLTEITRTGRAPRVVELCCGSGAISLALAAEVPPASGPDGEQPVEIHAVELSGDAMQWATRNLEGSGVSLYQADMADALGELDGTCDLVIANPPYIPLAAYEGVPEEVRRNDPEVALFSGEDGLDAMRVLSGVAARLLKPGGLVCAEHAELQEASAPQVFVDQGQWHTVRDHRDLNDRPRFVTALRN